MIACRMVSRLPEDARAVLADEVAARIRAADAGVHRAFKDRAFTEDSVRDYDAAKVAARAAMLAGLSFVIENLHEEATKTLARADREG